MRWCSFGSFLLDNFHSFVFRNIQHSFTLHLSVLNHFWIIRKSRKLATNQDDTPWQWNPRRIKSFTQTAALLHHSMVFCLFFSLANWWALSFPPKTVWWGRDISFHSTATMAGDTLMGGCVNQLPLDYLQTVSRASQNYETYQINWQSQDVG